MELKKIVLATAAFGALGGLYGCSGDEDANIVIDDNSVTTTTTNNTTTNEGDGTGDSGSDGSGVITCPSIASITIIDGTQYCQLPSTILEDVTLTADAPYFMNRRVTVGNGNGAMGDQDGTLASGDAVTEVVLTIEAGTQIFAENNTFANLLITRGSEIRANGTAAAPIVFSSIDDGFDGNGEWGGLILQGYGLHVNCNYPEIADATAAQVACNVDGEGESGEFGGHDNADSSGNLNYVVVAEGGFEFAVGNEINGVSFLGVGSGTEVDYLQVHNNSDDGVEFYGGAVNVSHLVLTDNQDESIDWDEGYQGNIQFAIVKQNETSDHGIEADTEGDSVQFLSTPVVFNTTFLGAGDGASVLHRFKDTTGGYIFNSVFAPLDSAVDTIDICVDVQDDSTAVNGTDGFIRYTNIVAQCDAFEGDDGDTTATNVVRDNVVVVADALVDTSTYASGATEANTGLSAIDLDAFNTAIGDAQTAAAGNGRSYSSVGQADASFLDSSGFTYSGAIEPGAATLWFDGWILDGTL